jgi:hypothetical protein
LPGIATALEVSLDSEKHPYARFGTDAYLEYLQGREFMATNRVEDAERAIGHFGQAIEIAPEFAAAYAALAGAHWQLALLQQTSGTDSPSWSAAIGNASIWWRLRGAQPCWDVAAR